MRNTMKFETIGTMNTTTEVTEEGGKVTVAKITQSVSLAGGAVVDDENGIELSMSGDVIMDVSVGEGKPIHQTQYVGVDMTLTKTTLAMQLDAAGVKGAIKVSSDEDTMKSLMKSKTLRLVTEDGKEVSIEINI